jgi:hypothetical protein
VYGWGRTVEDFVRLSVVEVVLHHLSVYGAHVLFDDEFVDCIDISRNVDGVGVVVKDGWFVNTWRSGVECECMERVVRVLSFLTELRCVKFEVVREREDAAFLV